MYLHGMKNYSLWMMVGVLLWGSAATNASLAQATLVDAPDTVFVSLDTLDGAGDVAVQWDVVNETDSPLNLMVTRGLLATVTPFNYPYVDGADGSYERFCWGASCFNYGTDASPENPAFLVNLNPGDTTSTFVSDFYPNGVVGTSTIRYCFHEVGAQSSGVCHAITFVVEGTVGVAETPLQSASVTSLSPNPATNAVTVSFDRPIRGALEFRNLVGQVHKTELVAENGLQQTFSLDGMSSGIWLVTYRVDGVAASTKRLVIR